MFDELPLPERPHNVLAAVMLRLSEMPDPIAQSPTALAAQELAKSIDLGTETYRFQSALVGQLRDCMAELEAAASAVAEQGDDVDDLAARRAARRAKAQASEPAAAGQ